jgi:hypothetical protein
MKVHVLGIDKEMLTREDAGMRLHMAPFEPEQSLLAFAGSIAKRNRWDARDIKIYKLDLLVEQINGTEAIFDFINTLTPPEPLPSVQIMGELADVEPASPNRLCVFAYEHGMWLF